MRRAGLLAVAAVLLTAAPGSAVPTKPPLSLSTLAPRQTDTLVVRGSDCTWTGLGTGYDVVLTNGHSVRTTTLTETDEHGDWRASFDMSDGLPAGRYEVDAVCFDTPYPHTKYPLVHLTMAPAADVRADGPLTASPDTVAPGGAVRVSGGGFGTFFDVGVFLGTTYLSSLPHAEDPSGTVTVPAGTAPGTYRLLAQGAVNGAVRTLATTLTVADPARPAATTTPAPAGPATPQATRPVATRPPTTPPPAPTTAAPTTAAPTTAAATTEPPTPEATAVLVAEGEPSSLPLLPVGAGAGAAAGVGAAMLLVVRRRRARPVH